MGGASCCESCHNVCRDFTKMLCSCWSIPGMSQSFEVNIGNNTCSKWVLRVVNFLLGLTGLGFFVIAAMAMSSGLPILESWPLAILLLGMIFVIVGTLGVFSGSRGCSVLALTYFCCLLIATVCMFVACIYVLLNREKAESTLKYQLEQDWPTFNASLPTKVIKVANCTTLDDPCWKAVKSYADDFRMIALGALSGFVLVQILLLVSICKIIGASNTANAVGLLMDTVAILLGATMLIIGLFAIPDEAAGVQLLFRVTGLALIGLATVFGAYCSKIYDSCCCSCNYQWAIATILYALMAIGVLALGIFVLTKGDTILNLVLSHMSSLCDASCLTALKYSSQEAIIGLNPACATSNMTNATANLNANVTCTTKPLECYDRAVKACDVQSAAEASFLISCDEKLDEAGWFLVLSFFFLILQVLSKYYKWAKEDEVLVNSSFALSRQSHDNP